MKFIAVTYGTEGDARPLSALCRALLDRGHEGRLLADRGTLGSAQSLGVPTTELAGDMKGALQLGGSISDVVNKGNSFASTANALARIANANAEAWMREVVAAGQGCDAIIVSGLAAFVGLSAAECLHVKPIGTGLIPITPTKAFPSPFLPPKSVPRFLNRASHGLVNWMLWRALRNATNAARTKVCQLSPRREGWRTHPMLYGVSPSLLPRPEDWPDNAHVCGQWIPSAADWSPPQALSDFLAAGEPPLYVGFGSMVGFDQKRLLKEVVAALAGRRALFNPGWSGADTSELPANLFVVGDTPHSWLFPRTSLVIHHGGSGTSHSATRAGVPSVVVPFAGDQYFWADRLKQVGVAPEPISGKILSARDLARSIKLASSNAMCLRAGEIGARMRAEDGLANATATVESLMAG